MAVWATDNPEKIPSWLKQKLIQGVWGIIAASLPYHPPAQVVHFLNKRGQYAYLARVGRGRAASPEIYSAGPGFLLSAGGIAFAPRVLSKTAARPITLLLDDNAHDFNDCFQIPGKTSAGGKMNNTGVAHRFACGNTPVMIPQQYNPVATLDQWSIFKPLHDHWIWVIISENGTPMERHYALWPPLEIEERASTGTR